MAESRVSAGRSPAPVKAGIGTAGPKGCCRTQRVGTDGKDVSKSATTKMGKPYGLHPRYGEKGLKLCLSWSSLT
jgi:hypothetical protein